MSVPEEHGQPLSRHRPYLAPMGFDSSTESTVPPDWTDWPALGLSPLVPAMQRPFLWAGLAGSN
jgi:hypothetical protein